LRKIEDVQRDLEIGINFFDLPGDFARVTVRAIGSCNQREHPPNWNVKLVLASGLTRIFCFRYTNDAGEKRSGSFSRVQKKEPRGR
jgi:hypothetical protein